MKRKRWRLAGQTRVPHHLGVPLHRFEPPRELRRDDIGGRHRAIQARGKYKGRTHRKACVHPNEDAASLRRKAEHAIMAL
jgi:hypothetical protein